MKQFRIGVLGNRSHLITRTSVALTHEFMDKTNCKHPEILGHHKYISKEHDIVFCLGYYRLIKPEFFNRPRLGTFVLHATDLPKGRGWAPVNWALINKEDKIHITSFKIDEGCDTGQYYIKTHCDIDITDTYESAYQKVDVEFVNHINRILAEIMLTDKIELHNQVGEPTWNPKRTPIDSELDLNKTLLELWPLIRACDNKDYPAFFKLNNKKIYLRHEVEDE